MTLEFKETLDLIPLPMDERTAAVMGQHYREKIDEAGGIEKAAEMAVDAIYRTVHQKKATERGRLQRLYSQVYTREELKRLVINTFKSTGLEE